MNTFVVGYIGKAPLSPKVASLFEATNENLKVKIFHVSENDIKELLLNKQFNVLLVSDPFTKIVIDYLDVCSKSVKNTFCCDMIHNKNGVLCGYNTIASSFAEYLNDNNIKIENKKVLLLGDNSFSRSIKYMLNSLGNNSIFVSDRNAKNGADISYKDANNSDYNIVINTAYINPQRFNDERLVYVKNFRSLECVLDVSDNVYRSTYLFDAKELNKSYLNGFGFVSRRTSLINSLCSKQIISWPLWSSFVIDVLSSDINIVFLGVDTKYKKDLYDKFIKETNAEIIDFKTTISSLLKKINLSHLMADYSYLEMDFLKKVKDIRGCVLVSSEETIKNRESLRFLSKNGCFVYLKTRKFEDILSKNKKKILISADQQKETNQKYNAYFEKYADLTLIDEENLENIFKNIKMFYMGGKSI